MNRSYKEKRDLYELLSQIIADEPRYLPLSDEEITERISMKTPISQMTVFRMRHTLKIGNSVERKRRYQSERLDEAKQMVVEGQTSRGHTPDNEENLRE